MINNGERYKYFNSVAESLFNERAETCLDIRLTGGTNEGRKCSRLALGKFIYNLGIFETWNFVAKNMLSLEFCN